MKFLRRLIQTLLVDYRKHKAEIRSNGKLGS